MTPPTNTTQPRNTPSNITVPTTVAFQAPNEQADVEANTSGTNFTDYKLYAASADRDPRLDTDPIDESPVPPPTGRMVGDGSFTPDETYTVQLTYRDETGAAVVLTGHVPANEALPNHMVTITLE